MPKHALRNAPDKSNQDDSGHALYRQFSADGGLLYVGISCRIPQRVKEHSKHSPWWEGVVRIEIEHFGTREESLAAEKRAIIDERPKFNIHHKATVQDARTVMSELEGQRIVAKLVNLRPLYRLKDAATALGLASTELLTREIKRGALQSIEIPSTRSDKMVTYVSGWHLLDWLESWGAK
jgi:predicted GIY-YIG superfamily endonuclease